MKVKSLISRVACYADDTIKIFKSIDSITDCNALQSDLNDLASWSKLSGLIFNHPSVNTSVSLAKNHLYSPPILSMKRLWNLAIQKKTLVCGCEAISPRTNKWLNSVRKPTNSSALCAELLGSSKAPKRVLHFIFRSSGAISATQPKYGLHSPLAYLRPVYMKVGDHR